MPYIKYADNVYKFIRKNKSASEPGGTPTLIPIINMYVSGTHTEPVFSDSMVSIKSFTSSKSNIDTYSSTTLSQSNYNVQYIGIENIDKMSYTEYSTESLSQSNYNVQYIGIENIDKMSYTEYGNVSSNQSNYNVQYIGIENIDKMSYTEYTTLDTDYGPSHDVSIKSFTSNSIIIT
jgi:hypothetical protein